MALKSKAHAEARKDPRLTRAAKMLDEGTAVKRLNCDIPVGMHRELKALAAGRGVSVTDLVVESLRAHCLSSNE